MSCITAVEGHYRFLMVSPKCLLPLKGPIHAPSTPPAHRADRGMRMADHYSSSHMTLHHIEVVSLKSNLSVASVVSAKSFETGSRTMMPLWSWCRGLLATYGEVMTASSAL